MRYCFTYGGLNRFDGNFARFFGVIMCLCLCVYDVSGQGARRKATVSHSILTWTVREGLPDNKVYRVLPHSRGFLWGIVADKIFRFDGSRFYMLPMSAPLPSIKHLYELQDGTIAFQQAFSPSNFFLLNTETSTLQEMKLGAATGVSGLQNLVFGDGKIFAVGSRDSLTTVYRLDKNWLARPVFQVGASALGGVSDGAIRHQKQFVESLRYAQGCFWYSTGKGLARYEESGGRTQFFDHYRDGGDGLRPISGTLRDLVVSPDGRATLSFNEAPIVLRWSPGQPELNQLVQPFPSPSQSLRLAGDGAGNLVVWDGGDLLQLRLDNEWYDLSQYLKVNRIDQISGTDFSHGVFIATIDGLVKLQVRPILFEPFLHEASGLNSCLMRGMALDRLDRVFMFSNAQGMFCLDTAAGSSPKNILLKNEASGQSGQLSATANCAFDPAGHLWSTLDSLLVKTDIAAKSYRTYRAPADYVECFSLLPDGLHLLCNKAGALSIVRFDPVQETFYTEFSPENFPLQNANFSTYLYYDPQGLAWAGTSAGLICLDPASGRRVSFPGEKTAGFGGAIISVILETAPGILAVGSLGAGLHLLDRKSGTWTVFDERNGLPNNKVAGLVADERGHFWVSTYFGLCCLDPKSGRAINFFQEDGLSHNEFNRHSFLRDSAGRCWFGSINGVTGFDPEAILRSAPSPVKSPLLLSNVSWYAPDGKTRLSVDTALSSLNRLTIYPANRYCVFRFSLANFQNPLANQYAYRLDGLDDDWIYLGANPEIVLNHLSAGTYTLRVKAAGPDGEWVVYERPIRLAVLAPWYARWWAASLWALALAGMLVAFYRHQLRKKMEQSENKRLRELDEFKSRFFTNITHEFRTPLTVILGMTERLTAGDGRQGEPNQSTNPPIITQPLLLIKRNAENLLRLINQILDLAKMENNSLKANYVQGDVLPYLRYICESLHSMANAQNVLLRVESSEGQIVMDYDPERLLQIVHNLLSNAIKFTPSGGRVQLAVAVGSGSRQWTVAALPTANCLLLTVSDTGAGIPPEDLPNIFDRFYQANNLEKTKAGGTGIGLALTKELVLLMGGQIGVESVVGKGTKFTVTLPITKNAPLSEGVTQSHPLTPPPLYPGRSPEESKSGSGLDTPSSLISQPSLLIVEDNPDVVEYLAACLQDAYRLDFAYNGRAGIEKALEMVPDLIISDVMMPEKDGFEVCDFLKNDERTSHVPIVLLTAKADMESRIAGLRRGADAYLAKPFHKEELQVTIANLLESRKKWQTRFGNAESGMRNAELRSAEPDHSAFRIPDSAFDLEDAFVQKVRSAVEARLSDASFSVDHLCRAMAMSQPQLHRKLTALTGKNATLFIRSVRLAKAKELLSQKEKTVSEVAYEVGFDDPKYFSRVFAEEYGVAPSKA